MKATAAKPHLLTAEEIKIAKKAIRAAKKAMEQLRPLDEIEDWDGHTNGLAYEAHDDYQCMGDHLYALESILKRIENNDY